MVHWQGQCYMPQRDCRSRLRSPARTRTAICWSTQVCRRLACPPTSTFCWHQPSGSAAGQVDNRHQPGFPGCRPTDMEWPDDMTLAELLSTFRQQLKAHLFT